MATEQEYKGMKATEYDYRVKVILLGDVNVGKSSFIRVLSQQTELEHGFACKTYIQNSFVEVECIRDGKRILVKVIDTGGQEKFRSLTASYYRGVHGCLIFFNKDRPQTFNNIISWLDELHAFCPEHLVCTMLVGTSTSHQEPQISTDRATKLSEHINAQYSDIVMDNPAHVAKSLQKLADSIVVGIPRMNSLSVSVTPQQPSRKRRVFDQCGCS